MKVSSPIGARLYAVPTANASVLINKNNAILCRESSFDRANLDTRRIRALIAEFRHEEASKDVPLGPGFGCLIFRGAKQTNGDTVLHIDDISFDPRADKEVLSWDFIFSFAGLHTAATPYALINLDAHSKHGVR